MLEFRVHPGGDTVFVDPLLIVAVYESTSGDNNKVASLRFIGSDYRECVRDPDRTVAKQVGDVKKFAIGPPKE